MTNDENFELKEETTLSMTLQHYARGANNIANKTETTII